MSQSQPDLLPHDNAVGEIYRVNISFTAVTILVIGLRLIVRAFVVKHVAVDDYLMVGAGLFSTAFSVMVIVGIRYGLGKHIYDLPQDLQLIDRTKKVIQTLWTCQIMYATALMLVKISIVTSYLRVFPTVIFRRIMFALSAAIVAVWICSILVTIFQCNPVRGAWDFTLSRNCLPIVKFFYFTTAFSIFTDFLLCTLPLPVFWRLKLPHRQKYIVSVLFGVGLLATVASALRITVLPAVNDLDVTMGSVSTIKWSVVELGTGIVCACIPCLKPLFKNLLAERSSSNRSAGARSDTTAPYTPKPALSEESHELTRPQTNQTNQSQEGWSSFSRYEARHKAIPVTTMTTTRNFI